MDWLEGGVLIMAAPFLLFPTLKPLLTIAALLGLAVVWIVRTLVERMPWPSTPFSGAILLWMIALGIGISVTALPAITLPKTTGLILGLGIWRYLILIINTPRRITWAMIGLLGLGGAMTLMGILSINWPDKVPFLQSLLASIPSSLVALPEAPTTGVHANQLGGTILFYFPLVISFFWGGRPKKFPYWCWQSILVLTTLGLTAILILTQSRSAWIGAIGSLWVMLLLWIGMPMTRRKRWLLGGVAAGLFGILIIGIIVIGPARLEMFLQEPDALMAVGSLNTFSFRFEVWHWALTAIQDFPFTGCGLGTFRDVVRLLYPINVDPSYDIAHAHNIFLQVALDVGLPGLIAYLAWIGLTIGVGWRTAHCSANWRPLLLGILSGILALHIYGLTDALAPGSKPNLIFWYGMGLLAALGLQQPQLYDQALGE
jgi:putative inorganic carbon (HCO3(-)) transporter